MRGRGGLSSEPGSKRTEGRTKRTGPTASRRSSAIAGCWRRWTRRPPGGLHHRDRKAAGADKPGVRPFRPFVVTRDHHARVDQISVWTQGRLRADANVGSAARGEGAASDIDYTTGSASHPYFEGKAGRLPGVDRQHGLLCGTHDPYQGPAIRFEPLTPPRFVPRIP